MIGARSIEPFDKLGAIHYSLHVVDGEIKALYTEDGIKDNCAIDPIEVSNIEVSNIGVSNVDTMLEHVIVNSM